MPDLHANHNTIQKRLPQTTRMPDTEIYVIVGDHYDKSREGQMYIYDSMLSFSLAC